MKKIYTTLFAVFAIAHFSYAQWASSGSHVYYNSGNLGIDTTSPAATLNVGKLLGVGELGSVLARLVEGNGAGTYLGVRGYDTQPQCSFPCY